MHPRVVVLVTSLAVVPLSWPAAASPQLRPTPIVPERAAPNPGRAPAPTWDTFTADVTIRRRVVKADGSTRFQGPEMRYRWTRRLEDAGWKTTMTLLSASPDTIVTDKGPRQVARRIPVSRLEFGDATAPARIFDADGRMVFMLPTRAPGDVSGGHSPTAAVRAAMAKTAALGADLGIPAGDPTDPHSRDWVEPLLPAIDGRTARRAAMLRSLGAVRGLARGLERFVSERDGVTTEVLGDPAWAVPREINVAREGRLISHTVLDYLEAPGAGLVRRRMRSEHLLSPESGDRAVVDLEFADVRLTRGGRR